MFKSIVLILFFFISAFCVNAQEDDLGKVISGIKTSLTQYYEAQGKELESYHIPVLLDYKPADTKMLSKYTLEEIKEVKISFDKLTNTALYGASATYGIIMVSRKQKDEKKD